MTSRDPLLYLGHIHDALAAIAEYTALGREAFFGSKMMRDAVVRNIEIIGEAVKRLPQEVTDRAPEIPWRNVAGMRDVIVHDYFAIDDEIVWSVVERDLPKLRAAVERLFARPPSSLSS
jgi:uncharacterized protein with HEPN domain